MYIKKLCNRPLQIHFNKNFFTIFFFLVKEFDLERIFTEEEEETLAMKDTYWQLEMVKGLISSRHFMPVRILSKFINRLENNQFQSKMLNTVAINQLLEILEENLQYHPPNNKEMRKNYKKLFGDNVVSFICSRIGSDGTPFILRIGLIQFCIKVLAMDFTFWWKDQKKSKNHLPLIDAFKKKDKLVVEKLTESKKNFRLFTSLLNLFAIICNYTSHSEHQKTPTLKIKSSKQNLASSISKMYSEDQTVKKVVTNTGLLRPSWLSVLVLVQKLNSQTLPLLNEKNSIDPKLESILKDILPDEFSIENLANYGKVLYFSLISRALDSIPIHKISRLYLKSDEALKTEVILNSDITLMRILKKPYKKEDITINSIIVFDSGVGMDQEKLNICTKSFIQLQLFSTNFLWQLQK